MSDMSDVGASTLARNYLSDLSEGVGRWIGRNLPYFDPLLPVSPLPVRKRIRAAIELALLCRVWAELKPATDVFHEANALLETIWARPEFLQIIDAHGGSHAEFHTLAYAALAPVGTRDDLREAALARLRASDCLLPSAKSSFRQLEVRYFADMANVAHGMRSGRDLAATSLLVRLPAAPVSQQDAYLFTHTAFYLSDFGCCDLDLAGDVRARAERFAGSMLDSCVRQNLWDLVAELIITTVVLGAGPVGTKSGEAGIRCLARAQADNGAIPGASAADGAQSSRSAAEFFCAAYHPTLATALMTLIVG
jgi:hypothetical protein